MHWYHYTPYTLPLLLAAAVSLALAIYSWRRRPAPEATAFAALMLAVGWWSLTYAMELESGSLAAKTTWLKLEYPGIVATPLAWLVFALQFAGLRKWVTRRKISLLAVIPLVTTLVAWTNDVHGLLWSNIRLHFSGPLPLLDLTYGPWFAVHVVYSYLLLLVGTLLIIRSLLRSAGLYRGQAAALLTGALAPWAWNVFYLSDMGPVPDLDLSPYVLTFSGLAVAWGIHRYRLFDIVPVAREALIESMDDGVIVLDIHNRIIDLNPAARRVVSHDADSDVIGQPAAQVFSDWDSLTERFGDTPAAHAEIARSNGDLQRHYDVRITPLYDGQDRLTGRLIVFRDITAHKQTEQALRESRAQFRDLFENANDLIQSVAPDGSFIYVNQAWRETLGYTEEDLSDLSFVEIIHPDHLARCRQVFWQVTSGRSLDRVETKFLTKDGEPIVVEGSVNCNFDEAGNPVATRAIFRDITQRKRTEERLARLRECLLSFGPDPLENINRVTALCGELLGAACALYNRLDQGMLCSWGQWNTPPDYDPVDAPDGHICYDVIRQAGEDVMVVRNLPETRYAQTDPNVTPYGLQTYVGQAVKFGGSYVGSLCAVFQEDFEPTAEDKWLLGVTASAVAVEEKRKQAEEELQRERDFASAILETAGALVVVLDPRGRIVRFNRACEQTTGYSFEEVQGKPFWDLFLVPEEVEPVRDVFQTLKATHAPGEYENYWVTKDGRRRLMSWSNTTLTDSDGSVQYVIGIGIDITERRRAEEERKRLLEAEHEQRLLAETMAEVTLTLTSHTSYEDVLDEILRQVKRIVPYKAANIMLRENHSLRAVRWQGYEAFDSEAFVADLTQSLDAFELDATAVASGEPVVIPDTRRDPQWVVFDETAWIRSNLIMPICLRDHVLGLLRLDHDVPGAFSAKDADRLQHLINTAAIALERAQLFDETQQHLEELELLHQVSATVSRSLELDKTLQLIIDSAVKAVPSAEKGSLHLLDEAQNQLVMRAGFGFSDEVMEAATFEVGEGYTGWVFAQQQPLIIDDVSQDPRTKQIDLTEVKAERSAICVPLVVKDSAIGTITLDNVSSYGAFDERDLRLLSNFGNHAAIAIENARLYASVQRELAERKRAEQERERLLVAEREQRELSEALRDTAAALNSTLDLDQVLEHILASVGRVVPHDTAEVFLIENGYANLVRSRGFDDMARSSPALRLPVSDTPNLRQMVETGEPLAISKTQDYDGWVEVPETHWVRSYAGAPIRAQGEIIGFVSLLSSTPSFFSDAHAQRLQTFANQAGTALENAQLLDETRRRAAHQEALNAIIGAAAAAPNLPELLDSVLQHTLQALEVSTGAIWVGDQHAIAGLGPEFGDILYQTVQKAGLDRPHRTVVMEDWQNGEETDFPHTIAATLEQFDIRSSVFVPVVDGGRHVGGLALAAPQPRQWDADEVKLAESVGQQLGAAAERLRLFAATEEHAELMSQLIPLSEELNRPRTQSEVLEAIGQGAVILADTQRIAIYRREPEDRVSNPWSQGLSETYLDQVTARAQELPGSQLLDNKIPVLINDVENLPEEALLRSLAQDEDYRALALWPLLYEGTVVAAVGCYHAEPRTWSEAEREAMQAFCRQAAIALENARLFEETRQRQDELAALYQTSLETATKSVSREDIQPLLERIVERATELLGGDGGGLYLADADGQSATCVVSHRTPEDYTGVTLQQGEGAAGTVLETGEPLVVDDYSAWSGQAAAFDADQPFHGVISVPLQWADRVTGILHVLDFSGTRKFDQSDLRMLEMFAHHAATAIEYSRRLEAERRWAIELETLHQMALDVTTQLELPGLLEVVVQRATDLLGAKGGAIYLYHPDQQELEVVVSHNQEEDYTGRRLRLGEGLSGKAVEQQRPLTVDDYGTWAGRAEEQYGDAPFTAIIAVPLQIGERVLGVLNITEEAEDRTFDADDVRLAMLFASQAAVALENARLYQELEDAYLDTILALANAVDARDTYTGDHSQKLAQWAAATGRELGCSEKELETLRWAALLHDIGKIGIPDSILQKPGPLTEEEKAVIERHPEIGEQIVAPVKQLARVAPIIRAHQEWWDGTGYPDGTAGEDIPLEARILAVVDAYGAMTDDRVYREALSHDEAVDELKRCAGTQFDPEAVDAFLEVLGENTDDESD